MHVIRDTGMSLTVILHKDDIQLIKTKKLLGVNPIVFESNMTDVRARASKVINLRKLGIKGWYIERDHDKDVNIVKLVW
ncbi:hypothetical protein MIF8_20 [Erwinia phage MIF8]